MSALKCFICLIIGLLGLMGCAKEDRKINMNLTEVSALYTPEDNLFVKLEPSTSASVIFEWEQAKAEDGSLVMYEIAFDNESGDFDVPVYKMASDGNGVQNKLTLSHKDLNRIANLAGIQSLETGKLKWTVLASKGINVKKSSVVRIIEVERPAGFAEIPSQIFITGSATEAGTDVNNAIEMKSLSPGVYEIYTKLSEGTYHFLSRRDENATSYQIHETFLREGEAVESPNESGEVYRIELDFNNAAVKMANVEGVGLWFAPHNHIQAELKYDGNGVFILEDEPIEFKQEGWGRDERYKFRMLLKDGNGDEIIEDWGSINRDNQRPNASTSESWYKIFKQDVNQWDYCFKFPDDADMATVDIILSYNPGADYYHEVIIK